MSHGKSSLLRKLIPKSYHFDGYNELNYPNTRDKPKPFFAENVTPIGHYHLTTRIDSSNNLILEYASVCPSGIISFKPYTLSFESFIELLRKSLAENSDFITFEIQTTYRYADGLCRSCPYKSKDCSSLLKTRPSSVMAAISFEVSDIKNALSVYFGINNTQTLKGGNSMSSKMKKLFGMNFELGMSKDRNIASTLMGVAVRNPENGNWYVFDSIKHTRTNIADMKMGDFPVFLLPAQTLAVGDLTKMDGKYYYVQAIDQNYITLLGAADGIVRQLLPSESLIPGMNFYTKVVAFDTKTFIDPRSKENVSGNIIAAMCLMQWKDGGSEFSLDNVDDNSFNGLGKFLPILMASGGAGGLGNMFGTADGGLNLPMLMMMGSGGGSDEADDMIQMMVLGQLLGGGNGNSMFGAIPGIAPIVNDTSFTSVADEVYCPSCGATYSSDVQFCIKCGTHTAVKGKVCSSCGATLKDDAAFCHVCGHKVLADTCFKCGAKIMADANFCPGCGTSLKASTKEPATAVEVSKVSTSVAPDGASGEA